MIFPYFKNYSEKEALAPYSYSKMLKVFLFYENAKSVRTNAYIIKENLKDLMFWRDVYCKEIN